MAFLSCVECLFLFFSSLTYATKSPYLVIFVADDLGWYDVSYHGSQQILTPNIDSLASQSVVLDNYYTSPLCTPSRAALLTGVHPVNASLQHGVILSAEARGLPLNLKILPQYLSSKGYKSHLIGKWHLGFCRSEFTPTRRGFDSHFGFWTGKIGYYDHANGDNCEEPGLDFWDDMELARNVTGIYTTDLFTERAVKIINEHDENIPLFLMVSYQSVHTGNMLTPLEAPDELVKEFSFIQNEKRRIFAAMLLSMDQSIGKIMNSLKSKNLLDNSLVIFMSDNGAAVQGMEEGSFGSNFPLRGSKFSLWDGGMRVPAFIWSPNLKPRVSMELFHVTDWLPTILSGLGIDFDQEKIGGVSQWEMLFNGKQSARTEILHNIDPISNASALRVGRFKLVQGIVERGVNGWYSLPPGSHDKKTFVSTKIECTSLPHIPCSPSQLCLFDMEEDACEERNIASQMPDLVNHLWTRIQTLSRSASFSGPVYPDVRACPALHGGAWSCWLDDS